MYAQLQSNDSILVDKARKYIEINMAYIIALAQEDLGQFIKNIRDIKGKDYFIEARHYISRSTTESLNFAQRLKMLKIHYPSLRRF